MKRHHETKIVRAIIPDCLRSVKHGLSSAARCKSCSYCRTVRRCPFLWPQKGTRRTKSLILPTEFTEPNLPVFHSSNFPFSHGGTKARRRFFQPRIRLRRTRNTRNNSLTKNRPQGSALRSGQILILIAENAKISKQVNHPSSFVDGLSSPSSSAALTSSCPYFNQKTPL